VIIPLRVALVWVILPTADVDISGGGDKKRSTLHDNNAQTATVNITPVIFTFTISKIRLKINCIIKKYI